MGLPLEIVLVQSANHPTDDVSPAGGSATTTEIDTADEWMTPLEADETGTLDVNTQLQYQVAYVRQESDGQEVDNIVVSLKNGILSSYTAGTISVSSTSASDNSTYILRLWGKDGSSNLLTEDLTMNGTSTVTSSGTFNALYRAELRNATTDAQATSNGDITITNGTSDIGLIPTGYKTATSEFSFGAPAAVGFVSTWSNRKTDPGSITWSNPCYIDGSTLSLPGPINDDGAGTDRNVAVYCRQTAQPGIDTADIDIVLWVDGEVTRL